MNAILFPERFTPAFTDNFASNEIIVKDLTAQQVFNCLTETSLWSTYYENVSNIRFHNSSDTKLFKGARFIFTTFSFPVEAEVTEYETPFEDKPARVAWHGWVEGTEDTFLDVHHAWLFENLPNNRVRILTQETQIGKPAQEMAITKPNPMINAHQDWIEGLAKAARKL